MLDSDEKIFYNGNVSKKNTGNESIFFSDTKNLTNGGQFGKNELNATNENKQKKRLKKC